MQARGRRTWSVALVLVVFGCRSTIRAPAEHYAGRLESPLGPIDFGLELGGECEAHARLLEGGEHAATRRLVRSGDVWLIECEPESRLEIRATADPRQRQGAWRLRENEPLSVTLVRVPEALCSASPPPALELAALAGTWIVELGSSARRARLEFDPEFPSVAWLQHEAFGSSLLSVVAEAVSVYEGGTCASLTHLSLTLAGFDGQKAWLLRGSCPSEGWIEGELWSSELGSLSWSAHREERDLVPR